jgi:hypothetical protein
VLLSKILKFQMGVKRVIQEEMPEGINESGLTLKA